ncbi:MAG TPA: tRNA-dihydrouridine synthase [Solirubrobacterales bacterium]|nr:tRNA-dihydrouridine synthase [Solirubrobacterales bacterium]
MSTQPPLTAPFRIGDVEIANRVLLAPLAGIGNWFVRLQARRHGAGLAVSEMVSSHAIHYRNERTLSELLRIHPDEHPTSIQLFGADPEIMRGAASVAAAAGADLIDLNMGCPVKKVRKTGAGAELISDPDLAVEVAAAAVAGSDRPVTVKLRSGLRPGDRSGVAVAVRLVEEAGVAAIAFHPRSAAVQHKGSPDYPLVRELVGRVDVPVIVSGGLDSAERARTAYRESGADAVMIARGSFGYPWIFAELTGRRSGVPERGEIVAELLWLIDAAEEHLGSERAGRYLRKFYPWYLARIGLSHKEAAGFQSIDDLDEARSRVRALGAAALVAA